MWICKNFLKFENINYNLENREKQNNYESYESNYVISKLTYMSVWKNVVLYMTRRCVYDTQTNAILRGLKCEGSQS